MVTLYIRRLSKKPFLVARLRATCCDWRNHDSSSLGFGAQSLRSRVQGMVEACMMHTLRFMVLSLRMVQVVWGKGCRMPSGFAQVGFGVALRHWHGLGLRCVAFGLLYVKHCTTHILCAYRL